VTYKHGAEVLLSLECLEAVGFIGYTSIPVHGKTPKAYFLRRAGFMLFAQATDLTGTEIKAFRETHKELAWTPAMYHRIRLVDCFLALERAVSTRPQLTLQKTFLEYRRVRGSAERETTDYAAEPHTSANRIVPDGAFILKNLEKDRRGLFFVEMDIGTERVRAQPLVAILVRVCHEIFPENGLTIMQRSTCRSWPVPLSPNNSWNLQLRWQSLIAACRKRNTLRLQPKREAVDYRGKAGAATGAQKPSLA
jgi:hypothetical protein